MWVQLSEAQLSIPESQKMAQLKLNTGISMRSVADKGYSANGRPFRVE